MKYVIVLFDDANGVYVRSDYFKIIHWPGDSKYSCNDIEINLSILQADSMSFTIYRTNPNYQEIDVGDKHIFVYLMDSVNQDHFVDHIVFHGTIDEVDRDMYGTKTVHCTGVLGMLDRVIQPQYQFQGTPDAYLARLISVYNDYIVTGGRYDMTAGTVDTTDNYILRYTNYESTLECMRNDLMKSFGVYPKLIYGSSTEHTKIIPALSFLTIENYGDLSDQVIQFGDNLLDYVENTSIDDLYTAVIPLGKKKDDSERTSSDISALDAYVDISSVNSGSVVLTLPSYSGALANYGFKCAVVHWDDVTDPATLKSKAQDWLDSAQYANVRFELSAIDLSMLGADIDRFKVGDRVRCVSEWAGLDVTLPIFEMTIYPLSPDQNTITVGGETPRITSGSTTSSNLRNSAEATLESLIQIETYEGAYTVNGSTQTGISADTFNMSAIDGYTPIGIARVATGNANTIVRAFNVTATGSSAVLNLRNMSTSQVSATATIDVIYVKTDVTY